MKDKFAIFLVLVLFLIVFKDSLEERYYKSFLPENHIITIGKATGRGTTRRLGMVYEYQDATQKMFTGIGSFGERFQAGEHLVVWYLPDKPNLSEWIPSGNVSHIPFGTILTDSAYSAIAE